MSPATRQINLPMSEEAVQKLHAGDSLALVGTIYTARDAAHQRLVAALDSGTILPIDLHEAIIYYCGPTSAPPGRSVGAAGPTTSSRMDSFADRLYEAGVRATIGKGPRAAEIRKICRANNRLYLVATGGAGALLSAYVRAAHVVAYPELGPEAIYHFAVTGFPVLVAYDVYGASIFPGDEDLD